MGKHNVNVGGRELTIYFKVEDDDTKERCLFCNEEGLIRHYRLTEAYEGAIAISLTAEEEAEIRSEWFLADHFHCVGKCSEENRIDNLIDELS